MLASPISMRYPFINASYSVSRQAAGPSVDPDYMLLLFRDVLFGDAEIKQLSGQLRIPRHLFVIEISPCGK